MRNEEDVVGAIVAGLAITCLLSALMGDCAGEARGIKMGECNAIISAAKTPSDTLRWMAKGCTP